MLRAMCLAHPHSPSQQVYHLPEVQNLHNPESIVREGETL